eukprot:scaffold161804_cov19-Tisochrysis_lutea.AAC.3
MPASFLRQHFSSVPAITLQAHPVMLLHLCTTPFVQAAQDFGPGNLGSQQPQSQRSSTAGLLKSKHSSSQDAERSLQSTRPSSTKEEKCI